MRHAKDTDFFIELPDVGTFRFGRRTYGDRLKIRSEYLRMTKEFGNDDADLSLYAAMIATHWALCVDAPKGWESLAEIDMVSNDDAEDKIYELYNLLKEKEDFFRRGLTQDGQEKG